MSEFNKAGGTISCGEQDDDDDRRRTDGRRQEYEVTLYFVNLIKNTTPLLRRQGMHVGLGKKGSSSTVAVVENISALGCLEFFRRVRRLAPVTMPS